MSRNGDAKAAHGHFKNAVDQALLLRGFEFGGGQGRSHGGCACYFYDAFTGENRVSLYDESPGVVVLLDDGTRLTLNEYQDKIGAIAP